MQQLKSQIENGNEQSKLRTIAVSIAQPWENLNEIDA